MSDSAPAIDPGRSGAVVRILAAGEWAGAREAMVERVLPAGARVRVELRLDDGSTVDAEIPREQVEQLELGEGRIVPVALARVADPSTRA